MNRKFQHDTRAMGGAAIAVGAVSSGSRTVKSEIKNSLPLSWTRAWSALAALAAFAAGSAYAAPTLEAVDVKTLPDNRIAVELSLSEPVPAPKDFGLETPPRISVDLPDTVLGLSKRRINVNTGVVDSISTASSSTRTRVVLNLNEYQPYTVRSEGNRVIVEIDSGAAPATFAAADQTYIEAVDFRRAESGAGRLIINLGGQAADVDVRDEGGKIIADFKNTAIPPEYIRRMDVLDFATPVKFVDATPDGINTRFTITPATGADFEQVAYQLADTFTIELQPLTLAQKEERQRREPQFTGERLNLNFQNIETRALLQIIADVAGKNLVTSDAVKGEVTLRLQNVPWDQALDIVLRSRGLSKTEQGNVIWVAPTDEVAKYQKIELEAMQQREELSPLVSELVQINYAKASDIADLLEAGDKEAAILSERGTVTVDERTNKLIIKETRDRLESIRSLIRELDVPVRQVLIEARIVIANDDFTRSIGTRFGVNTANTSSNNIVAGSGDAVFNRTVQNALRDGNVAPIPEDDTSFAINLPATTEGAVVPRYALSILGSDFLVDLELSALQAEAKGELISSPRIVTADRREAVIEQGEEIPFTSSSGGGGGNNTTQFKQAVLSLRVTPQITPDGRVIMDLEVTRDSRGSEVPQAGGGTALGIDKRKINTQVLVNNGDTVVLGGILETTSIEREAKVPLLGDIPVLGALFRTRSRTNDKSELLLFITPKILSEGVALN